MANPSDADAPAPAGRRLGEAAAQWVASRWVDVAGARVRYREAGSGPAVVLVHGLGLSADYWVRMAPAFAAAGYRVLAPDLPGFGRTPGPQRGLGIDAQAAALEAWSDALGLPAAVYLGHSISCQSVVELAVARPERVRALVLAAPGIDGPPLRRLLRQAWGFARNIRRESLLLAVLVAQAYLRAGPLRVLRTWKLGTRHDPVRPLIAVRAPCLIVFGDDDPLVDREFLLHMARILPHATLAEIPDAPHGVVFEPTGEFNRVVLEFLKEVEGPG